MRKPELLGQARRLALLLVAPALTAMSVTVYQHDQGGVVVIESGTSSGDTDHAPIVIGSMQNVTTERRVGSFHRLQIDIPADLTYTVSTTRSFKITGPANVVPLVTTDIEADKLVIGLRQPVVLHRPIRIVATGPDLRALSLFGSGQADCANVSGGLLTLSISGSGVIRATGRVGTLHIDVTGSGEIDASALPASRAVMNLSGSGTIKTRVDDSLSGRLTGSGEIVVWGNPHRHNIDVAGSGRVVWQ